MSYPCGDVYDSDVPPREVELLHQIRLLERERDALQAKLDSAEKQIRVLLGRLTID